jgi:hypothetical protein
MSKGTATLETAPPVRVQLAGSENLSEREKQIATAAAQQGFNAGFDQARNQLLAVLPVLKKQMAENAAENAAELQRLMQRMEASRTQALARAREEGRYKGRLEVFGESGIDIKGIIAEVAKVFPKPQPPPDIKIDLPQPAPITIHNHPQKPVILEDDEVAGVFDQLEDGASYSYNKTTHQLRKETGS